MKSPDIPGRLICPFHHHVVHHTNWNINRDHNRNITIWRT
jgi:hypothetical protein